MSPMAPPRPCLRMGLGCPHMRPCPIHGAAKGSGAPWQHDRPSAAARGYGRRWQRLRLMILQRDMYLCQACKRAGRLTLATSVDHIQPKAEGGDDSDENLEALCKACQQRKAGREGQRGRR